MADETFDLLFPNMMPPRRRSLPYTYEQWSKANYMENRVWALHDGYDILLRSDETDGAHVVVITPLVWETLTRWHDHIISDGAIDEPH